MESIKKFSRGAFGRLFFVWAIILLGIEAVVYVFFGWGGNFIRSAEPQLQNLPPEWLDWLMQFASRLSDIAMVAYIVSAVFVFCCLMLQWLMIRSLGKKMITAAVADAAPAKTPDKMTKEERQNEERRKLYHYLSVLQRDGRLLDFLAEDLSIFADDQIGAAVRTIQENCKASINKYISPVPVLTENEGDDVDVPDGFDPEMIKLTGNVKGNPPFKGVLRHKGWQANTNNLPELGKMKNPKVLAPAEVEVL